MHLQIGTNVEVVLLHICRDPIVLPFYHSGMGYVLPMSASFFRAAQEVTVVVGEYFIHNDAASCIAVNVQMVASFL